MWLRRAGGVGGSQAVLLRLVSSCTTSGICYINGHAPFRSGNSRIPRSAAISSMCSCGRRSVVRAIVSRWWKRSRSRRPMPMVHSLRRVDRRVVTSSSGPWYGNVRFRFRGEILGASGGGVGGARWAEVSNKETRSELCNVTIDSRTVRLYSKQNTPNKCAHRTILSLPKQSLIWSSYSVLDVAAVR